MTEKQNTEMLDLAKRIAERAGKNANVAPELLYAPILWELEAGLRAAAPSPHPRREDIANIIQEACRPDSEGFGVSGTEKAADAIIALFPAPPPAGADGVREALALAREYVSQDHANFEEGGGDHELAGEIIEKIAAALALLPAPHPQEKPDVSK